MRRLAIVAAIVCGLPAEAQATTSTSYCLHGVMADGTWTRPGSAAHNGYPLGTRLWVTPAVRGRRRWTVRDRIGWGTEVDFWTASCAAAIAYGRRDVRIRVGWLRRVLIGRVRFPVRRFVARLGR